MSPLLRIGLLGVAGNTTTARYFETASRAAGHELRALVDLASPAALRDLDVLLVIDPALGHLEALRQAPCPVIGYLIDVHLGLDLRLAQARYLDHVFIAQPEYLATFRALPHASAHWLPLACDVDVHFVADQPRVHEVAFVGQLGKPGSERREVLLGVLSQFACNDYLGRFSPAEMGRIYSSARIVFNKSIKRDLNMRFFEGLASGALLVTDRIGNGLESIGREGEHYLAYDTPQEAIDKIRYYLAHEDERARIAAAGQELIFAEHTYGHRLARMLQVVASAPGARSQARLASPVQERLWRSEFLRMTGASPGEVAALVTSGPITPGIAGNAVVALGRGTAKSVRQWRKRLSHRRRNKA